MVSHLIGRLEPRCFWMGGGHPETKMRLGFEEFVRSCGQVVLV